MGKTLAAKALPRNVRRPDPIGAAPVPREVEVVMPETPEPTQEELEQQVTSAESRERAMREEEVRLREELTAAEAASDRAAKRKLTALAEARDARKHASLGQVGLLNEVENLTRQVVDHQRADRDFAKLEESWQTELDDLILEQARCMERRDEHAAKLDVVRQQLKADETQAQKTEAKIQQAEEKRLKDKERCEALKRQSEQFHAQARADAAARREVEVELDEKREQLLEGVLWWRRVALALFVVVCCTGLYRASGSGLIA